MEFNVEAFRKYVKGLIGTGTQADFAKAHGITKEHLSRMMRAENPGRPSISTLEKIAEGPGKKMDDLLMICGYSDVKKIRETGTSEEMAQARLNEVHDGFSNMTKSVCVYNSIEDFLDEYILLYDTKGVKFFKGEKEEYEGDGHFQAEYILPVRADFYMYGTKCCIFFVLYYSETKGGNAVILDAAFDGNSVCPFLSEESRQSFANSPFVYRLIKDHTAEERLLKAIFGDGNDEEVIVSFIGFGLRLPWPEPVSQETAEKFIRLHMENIDGADKNLAQRVLGGEDAEKVFENYENNDDLGSGFPAFAASVIRSETGIDFTFYKKIAENEDSAPVILISREEYGKYDFEDIKDAAARYAKELGLKEYGEYRSYVRDYIEEKMRFTV